jgi:hypothetical protein
MRFVDFPRPLPSALYEEATHAYVKLVSKRTHAIYRTGKIRRPGISDLDIIVVPVGPRYDNGMYFSKRRLPARLRSVFRHEPFVLPLKNTSILRYTTHARPTLVYGRDVIPLQPRHETVGDRWCMLFEDYCLYDGFLRRAEGRDQVSVRFLLSKLTSIRIPFATLNGITNGAGGGMIQYDGDGKRRELLATWFENGASAQAKAREAWDLLRASFDQLTAELVDRLKLQPEQDIGRFGYDFLRGERFIPGVDPDVVRARSLALRRYFESACVLAPRCKTLLPNLLFRDEIRAVQIRNQPPRWLGRLARLRYALDYKARKLAAALASA